MSIPLLLQCVRAQPDLDAIRAIVAAGLDWETALAQAARHGLAPLLYCRLTQACPALVPAPVLESLRARAAACAQRSLGSTAELFRVLDALQAHGIRAIPFKGPVVAWTIYESPGLREMSDLDLLVAPGEVHAAREALTAIGYELSLGSRDPKFYTGLEMPFHNAAGMQIDLHWQLGPSPFGSWFHSASVRARAVPVDIARREVPTLSPTDLLRYLCMHAAKHGWLSLRFLCDIASVLSRLPPEALIPSRDREGAVVHAGVDYETALADAESCGGLRTLLLGLALSRDLAGAELPPNISRRVNSEPGLQQLIAAATRNLMYCPDLSIMELIRWQWVMLNRPVDRVRYLWRWLLPNTGDVQWIPGLPYAAYFVVRLLRLGTKYLPPTARSLVRHSP